MECQGRSWKRRVDELGKQQWVPPPPLPLMENPMEATGGTG